MIALYLLASHLFGDFVLQSRFQAVGKLTDRAARTGHVLTYTAAFVPVAVVEAPCAWRAAAFLAGLFALHWLTDSRRFRSTLGDVSAWRIGSPGYGARDDGWRRRVWEERANDPDSDVDEPESVWWPPPNEWPAMPLLIDQTLHVCQLALLGGLLLA